MLEQQLFYVLSTQQLSINARQLVLLQIYPENEDYVSSKKTITLNEQNCGSTVKITQGLIIAACGEQGYISIMRRKTLNEIFYKQVD